MINLQTYLNANGSRVSYFSGSMDQLKDFAGTIEQLSSIQQYSTSVIGEIEKKVQNALDQARVTHLSSRL